MSRYNDSQNKFSKPCFPSSAGRIPNTPSIPITKAQLRTFRAIIIELTKIIPKAKIPLTKTANFTSYAKDSFDDTAQVELAEFVDSISEKGAYVVVSNSDPKNVDELDNFFDNLYSRHSILRIEASRAINSNGAKRGKVSELLIAKVETTNMATRKYK